MKSGTLTIIEDDNPTTAFPASEGTPGQQASRKAWETLREKAQGQRWWIGYLKLREEGWDWRKATFIAWMAAPVEGRQPETQVELAEQVLGLKNTSTIRKWREKQPEIDLRIEKLKMEVVGDALSDVLDALVKVAKTPEANAHQDRKLFLEMAGVYKGSGLRVGGMEDAPPVSIEHSFADLPENELDGMIANLMMLNGVQDENPE